MKPTKHSQIVHDSKEIEDYYLKNGRNKTNTAREFAISQGGVDSALWETGHPDLVSPWFRNMKLKSKHTVIRHFEALEAGKLTQDDLSPLPTPEEIAVALLRKIITWATEKDSFIEQLTAARKQVTNLTQQLKELKTEYERLLKIHNEQAKNSVHFTTTADIMKLVKEVKP
jgi:hypothetical protein